MSLGQNASTTMSLMERLEASESHFKWISIRRFVCLAFVLASSPHTFDLFSKAYDLNNVRIYDFVLLGIVIGVTYMVMDFFIRQYTRKIDFCASLNPLMRGVSIGILLNSGLIMIVHSMNLLDSIQFFMGSLQETPAWARCPKNSEDCTPTSDVVIECSKRRKINLTSTSAHLNYLKYFVASYGNNMILSDRIFMLGFIWTIIFIFSTAADATLIKVYKFAFLWKLISTLVALIILMMSEHVQFTVLLSQMLSISPPSSYYPSITMVCKIFNVGFIGVYDFGSISPFTMVDNAVLIFGVIFALLSFCTSFIIKFLYNNILNCINDDYNRMNSWHYFVFCIVPLSTEFANTQKFFMMYIYINFIISIMSFLMLVTLTIAKQIHNEFRFIKNIYIAGMLCLAGGFMSILMFLLLTPESWRGLIKGTDLSMLYLGGLKALIIFWIYGVNKFSTDIYFWLGYKPTMFWTICWAMLPISIYFFFGLQVTTMIDVINNENQDRFDVQQFKSGRLWLGLTCAVVGICQVKTVITFLLRNDKFECNHVPLAYNSAGDSTSLTNIYEAQPSTSARDQSSQLDVMHWKNN